MVYTTPLMTTLVPFLRRSAVFFSLLLALQLVFKVFPVFAEMNDIECLRQAGRERRDQLKDAQNRLRDEMNGVIDTQEHQEFDALGYSDLSVRQNELSRAQSNFSYESSQKWRNFSMRTSDVWNVYQRKRSECYASAIPESIPPAYTPTTFGPPSYYPLNYGSSYYGAPYGGYRDEYHGAGSCTQRPLSQPPPGCSYQFGTDSNGCPSVTPICNNAFSNTSPCTCPSQYAPVCTKEGQVYFNACYAACLGATVNTRNCYQY